MPHWERTHPRRTCCHGISISLLGISGSSRRSCWIWFRAGVCGASLQTPRTESHLHTASASRIRKGEEHLLLPHNSYHCLSLKEYLAWVLPQKTYRWARRMSRPPCCHVKCRTGPWHQYLCILLSSRVLTQTKPWRWPALWISVSAECKSIAQTLTL